MMLPAPKPILVLLLWVAGLGAAAQFAKMVIPFSMVAQTYPDAGNALGWLFSLISLVGAAFGIVAGKITTRFGAKQFLLIGLCLGAAMSFYQMTLPGFALMALSRMFEGISHLAIVVAAPTLISQLSDKKYVGLAMTFWSTFFGVAFAIVAWVVMPLLGNESLKPLFLAHGLFMGFIALLVAMLLPKGHSGKAINNERSTSFVKLHRLVYTSPNLSAPALGWLVYTLTFVSILAVLPNLLKQTDVTALIGLLPIISIITSLACAPFLLRLMPSTTIIMIGFALAALLALANIILQLQLAFAISLFAILGLIQGASFSAVAELNEGEAEQALAYGGMAQMGNTGNLLGTPIMIAILANMGEQSVYGFVATLYAIGFACHAVLAKRRNTQ